jgi:hypothetical protein
LKPVNVMQRGGRLLGQNTWAAELFQIEVKEKGGRANFT